MRPLGSGAFRDLGASGGSGRLVGVWWDQGIRPCPCSICTRNRAQKAQRAVASVLANSFTDFELDRCRPEHRQRHARGDSGHRRPPRALHPYQHGRRGDLAQYRRSAKRPPTSWSSPTTTASATETGCRPSSPSSRRTRRRSASMAAWSPTARRDRDLGLRRRGRRHDLSGAHPVDEPRGGRPSGHTAPRAGRRQQHVVPQGSVPAGRPVQRDARSGIAHRHR